MGTKRWGKKKQDGDAPLQRMRLRRILSYLYLEPETEEKDGRLCQKGVQKAAYTGPNKMVMVQQIRIIHKESNGWWGWMGAVIS